MRAVFLSWVLVLIIGVSEAWGQVRVLGRVLDKSNNSPISFATVALKSKRDSTLYKGTATDLQGAFRIDDVEIGRYTLLVSFVGYDAHQQDVRITLPSSGLDWSIDISLEPSSKQLGEVIVSGNTQRQLADRKIVSFTSQVKQRATYAKDLLKELPELKENPLTGRIESVEGGTLLVLVNGIRAAEVDIRSIPPDKVKHVEVYDVPPARYATVGKVVNIVTHRLDNGISGGMQTLSSPNTRFSDDMLYFSSTRGDHRWDVSYQLEHRNYKERLSETSYEYLLGGEVYADHTAGTERFGYDNHDIQLKYTYIKPEKRTLQLSLAPNIFTQFTHGVYLGSYQKGAEVKQRLQRNYDKQNKTFLPSLDLYYWKKGKKDDEWSANLRTSYFQTSGTTLKEETRLMQNTFRDNMSLQNRKYSLIGEVVYSKAVASNRWNFGYKAEYAHLSSDLNNVFGATAYTSDYFQQYGYGELVGIRGKILYKASLGLTHSYNKTFSNQYHQIIFSPQIVLGYNFTSATSLRLGLSRMITNPSINMLSQNATVLTPDIISRGNPDLLSGSATALALMATHSNRYLKLSAGFVYAYQHRPVEEYFTREGGKYYLTYRNADYAHDWGCKVSVQVKPFASDWLTLTAYASPTWQVVATPDGVQRQVSIKNFISARIAYQNAELSYQYTIPTYTVSGAFRSLSENTSNLMCSYKLNKWRFKAGLLFIGQDARYLTESLSSSLVKYTSDDRIRDNRSMLVFGLEYTFSSGQNKEVKRTLNNKDTVAPTF